MSRFLPPSKVLHPVLCSELETTVSMPLNAGYATALPCKQFLSLAVAALPQVLDAEVTNSILGDGCVVRAGTTIKHSVIGLRSLIGENCHIEDALIMGCGLCPANSRRMASLGAAGGQQAVTKPSKCIVAASNGSLRMTLLQTHACAAAARLQESQACLTMHCTLLQVGLL